MIFYRGKNRKNSIMIPSEQGNSKKNISFWGNLQVLKSPAFLKPFKCIGILQMLYNMSGFLIISTYTNTFLEVNKHLLWFLVWFLVPHNFFYMTVSLI